MKKIVAILLLLVMVLPVFSSCTFEEDDTVIKIGFMKGPTGMGMAKLISDNGGLEGNEKYEFVKFENANLATAALVSGEIDMACLPTNNAAIIYNTKGNNVNVLAINCLNSLFVMTKTGTLIDDISDLDNKTIYTISSGTPKAIIEYALSTLDISATVKTDAVINGNSKSLSTPDDLAAAMIAGAADIVLVPEPVATAAPLKIASQGKDYNYTVALDMSDVWSTVSDKPVAMGCLLAKSSFVSEHKALVDKFLGEYKSSIEYIASNENIDAASQMIVDATVLDALKPAKNSLSNLGNSVAFYEGTEMKNILVDFYSKIGVSLIGGSMPDDKFYYDE